MTQRSTNLFVAAVMTAALAAAAAFFLVNYQFSGIAMALAQSVEPPVNLLRHPTLNATRANVLEVLSPIVVVEADRNPAFIRVLLVHVAVI